MNTIKASSCTTWLHWTARTNHDFGVLWRNAWTLYDSLIEDQIGESKRRIGLLTWRRVKVSRASDLHRTRDRELPHDLHQTAGWRKTKNHDRHAIVARSSRDRGSFIAKSGATIPATYGPRSSCDRGHQNHLPTGSNGPELVRKSPFKNLCIPSLFLNS